MASNKTHQFDVADIVGLKWGNKRQDYLMIIEKLETPHLYVYLNLNNGHVCIRGFISPQSWRKIA